MSTEEQTLILTVFTYGPHQRRGEIELRPKVPQSARGNPQKIDRWLNELIMTIGPDFKHTNEWGCEMCGKPARECKYNIASRSHLSPPRVTIYIHLLCDAGDSFCHKFIQAHDMQVMGSARGAAALAIDRIIASMNPTSVAQGSESVYPLASSCANCNDPKTAKKDFRILRCGRCKLTRYCCPGCQHADRPRHKTACKIIESVNWVWPDPE